MIELPQLRHILCIATLSWVAGFAGGVVAEDDPSAPVKSIESLNLSTGGTGLYRPGKWGLIKVSLRNPNDRDVQLLATTYFLGNPTLQYGRRLWMPPNSRLVTWHPLRLPDLEHPDQKMFDLRSMVVSTSDGTESMASNEFGAMQFDQAFRVAADEPVTAMVTDPPRPDHPGPLWTVPQEFALTARLERGLRHNFTLLGEQLFPASEEVLDALDHLIIASNRMVADGAGIGAIRRWVANGGRLWIMADRVSPELLSALLGDEDTVTEVDRVDLTTVHLENGPSIIGTIEFNRELEQPTPLVRVVGENLEVDFLVNGWPASFWKSYGDGRILVTTLGGDGWLRVRTSSDPKTPSGTYFETVFFPSGPLSQLALDFFAPRTPPMITADVAEEELQQMIGYVIPSRRFVLGTLMAFTCLVLVAAAWAARHGRLEWMGWFVPGLASIAAGLLLAAGWSSRSTTTASTAIVQSVHAVPGSNAYRTSGVAGILSKESLSYEFSGIQGGWMQPEMAGLEGTTRRLVWSDLDRWSWENLAAKPGLRMAPFQTAGQVTQPIEAIGEFNERGIAGSLVLPPGLDPGDAIIATDHGRIGVELQSNGKFTANLVLGGGQYLSASVLSDEQQRRSRLMSHALAPLRGTTRPVFPALMVWTSPWEAGTSFLHGTDTVGSALVSIPLRWERPPVGTHVSVPSPFLPFREVHGPDGLRPSGLYDARHSRWVERSGAIAGWLAFAVPEELLPVEVKSANVAFKVLGPLERLELSTFVDGQRQSLKTWETPVGTLTHEIVDPQMLKLDSRGRLLLRVEVGRRTDSINPNQPAKDEKPFRPRVAEPVTYWQFEDASMQLSAEILPKP